MTAMGRCGTRFLAVALDRSRVWTVAHEPHDRSFRAACERFRRDFYGEVNGYLRPYFDRLPVAVKAVVVRHPQDIVLSVANWRGGIDADGVRRLGDALALVARHHDGGAVPIRFERMVSEPDYLEGVARTLGVEDAETGRVDLGRKINASRGKRRWGDLAAKVRAEARRRLEWFASRYGYEWREGPRRPLL